MVASAQGFLQQLLSLLLGLVVAMEEMKAGRVVLDPLEVGLYYYLGHYFYFFLFQGFSLVPLHSLH